MDIDDEIEKVWDEIGLDQNERSSELCGLQTSIEELKREFVKETIQKCQNLSVEIEKTKEAHIGMLRTIGRPESEIIEVEKSGVLGTLKERYDEVNDAFVDFKAVYDDAVFRFQEVFTTLSEYFTLLEIPLRDRGEFQSVGDSDLSEERFNRFRSKVLQLSVEIEANNEYGDRLSAEIMELYNDLGLRPSHYILLLSKKRPLMLNELQQLKEAAEKLKNEKEKNCEHIARLALEIKRLWDLLHVSQSKRDKFLSERSGVSIYDIKCCVDLINSLNAQRNAQIPKLVLEVKKEIKEICQAMHFTNEQQQEVFYRVREHMRALSPDLEIINNLLQTPVKSKPNESLKPVEYVVDDSTGDNIATESEQVYCTEEKNEQNDGQEKDQVQIDEGNEANLSSNIHLSGSPHSEKYSEGNPIHAKSEKKFADCDDLDADSSILSAEFPDIIAGIEGQFSIDEPISNSKSEEASISLFESLDYELMHLKKLQQQSQPILDLIKQRESLIEEFNKLKNQDIPKELHSLTSQKRLGNKNKKHSFLHIVKKDVQRIAAPNPEALLHAEKITRRYKTVLPRIEKKLAMALYEFDKENGEEFMVDGRVYSKELEHIKLTPTDKKMSRSSLSSKSLTTRD